MEVFEIHITADEAIIEVAKGLDVKTIVIDLVKPDQSLFRTEYMTSHIYRCENYDKCKEYVDDMTTKLTDLGVKIVRVKIECPIYQKYIGRSLYVEVHYESQSNLFPMSQNKGKDYFLCTAREYNKSKYDILWENHKYWKEVSPHWAMELCLYDTNVEEDKDWFDLYE